MPESRTTYALLIYRSTRSEMPSEELERALVGHRALQAEAASQDQLLAVARLEDVATARTIIVKDGGHEVTDGPYVETKEWLAGFYLVDCASLDEAVQRGRMISFEGDHVIEVRPVAWKLGDG